MDGISTFEPCPPSDARFGSWFIPHKGRGKDQRGKGTEGAFLLSGLPASETPSEEGHGYSWESDDRYSNLTDDSSSSTTAWYGTGHSAWMASVPLNLVHHPTHVVLDLFCTQSIGSRAAIRMFQKYALHSGIMTEFCPCNKSFVFANSETETCWESCIIHFPKTPPCSTRVDVLETGDVPILFSLSQMKNLGMTIELDPKGDKITCPASGLCSSPAEYSTMGHIVLDLTSLAYQPTAKSGERSGHPRKHVTVAMSEKTSISSSYTRHAWRRR